MEGVMGARWKLGVALVVSTTLAAGCAETLSLADLPNVTRLPEKLLSKEEQAKTMSSMAEKAQTHQAEAAKEIEKTK
jgi:outer membrane murein-binding lipoprotein Lpp